MIEQVLDRVDQIQQAGVSRVVLKNRFGAFIQNIYLAVGDVDEKISNQSDYGQNFVNNWWRSLQFKGIFEKQEVIFIDKNLLDEIFRFGDVFVL